MIYRVLMHQSQINLNFFDKHDWKIFKRFRILYDKNYTNIRRRNVSDRRRYVSEKTNNKNLSRQNREKTFKLYTKCKHDV